MLISIMLEERGLSYFIVPNGQEAIEEAIQQEYDLILMDINMPIMDGITATKKLREQNYNKPIVSLSANVIESDIKLFLEAGVDDTLNKPVVPEHLENILEKFLNFDTIDIETISKHLNIDNRAIVLKLLQSFLQTLQEILSKLESENLTPDIVHNIKGVTGNLRLKKIYNLMQKYEETIENWDEQMFKEQKKMTILHITKLIEQIKDEQ